jgi:hypothetical protein
MMILVFRPHDDLGHRSERAALDAQSAPDACVSEAANRAPFRIDRRLIASPFRHHRPCSPLSSTDTAPRSPPATEVASLADRFGYGKLPGAFRAFSRSLLAPLCGVMSHLVTRSLGSMTRAVPHCVAEPRQGEKVLDLSSGGWDRHAASARRVARRGSPMASK